MVKTLHIGQHADMNHVETNIRWINKLAFQGKASGHALVMDAKKNVGGQDLGMTPKELLLQAVSGCTGMDVAAMLGSKYKLPIKSLEVAASGVLSEGKAPTVFTRIDLTFDVAGELPQDKVLESVTLSMTKYCGVTAMVSKACPVHYRVMLNGEALGEGQAFPSA